MQIMDCDRRIRLKVVIKVGKKKKGDEWHDVVMGERFYQAIDEGNVHNGDIGGGRLLLSN